MDTATIEPEVVGQALELRRPDVPVDVTELAARKGEAIEIIEARNLILATVRKAAIRATHPEDWILFKSPDEQGGQIVGYLQDAGADRVRDFWGIEVFKVSAPEKIATNDPKDFMYLQRGSGRCKLTRQVVEEIEGGRSSKDDFCKDKEGAALELAVRKATRANLDGNITRELASLKSVPVAEIQDAWAGTSKKIDQCRRGRGFGTRDQRLGANAANEPNIAPPKCGVCGATAKYRPGKDGRPAFYGCPNYQQHADRQWSIEADKWAEQSKAAQATPAAAGPTPQSTAAAAKQPAQPTLREREPGEEG